MNKIRLEDHKTPLEACGNQGCLNFNESYIICSIKYIFIVVTPLNLLSHKVRGKYEESKLSLLNNFDTSSGDFIIFVNL